MANISLTAKGRDQELILAYLQNNASDILAEKINSGTPYEKDGKQLINRKDLNGFMTYACDEAKKLAEKGSRSACVEDSVVYGWAIHYFEEDSIEGKLYNQDGTEYKPPAPVKTTKPTPTPPPKPKPKSQFSFFDMLNDKKDEQPTVESVVMAEQITTDEPEVTADTEIENTVELQADDYEVVDNAASQDAEQAPTVKPTKSVVQEQHKPKNELYEKYITYVNRHPDSIIAMRVGDFYEVFGKRAVALAEEVGLTITGKDLGLEQRIPMIGFPYHAAEVYFKKIRQKHSVVVVENDGERKLDMFGIEDVLDGDDELTESEMRLFDGDIQEPKDIPSPESEQHKAACEPSDCSDDNPYDQAALAKVVKLLGNNFILE
ncbi:MAG: Cas9 inhibitor AcrIIA9 family protein [Roseburia sp.]|nr:Cas9 inhibitor AcrIIA9 family protein [Roseburia sp.]